MADGDQIQGLPPGAIVKPISGLPPGAVVRPIGGTKPSGPAANDPLVTGEGMIRNAQEQSHGQAVEGMRQAHGAPALISRPESSQAQDQAFDAAWGKGPSVRPTLSPRIGEVPKGMEATAQIAEGVPAVSGAASLFTPGIAAQPLRTIGAMAGGTVGGGAGRLIGETAGLSPENTQSLQDVGTLGGGVAGGTASEPNSWLARASRNADTLQPRVVGGAHGTIGTAASSVADTLLPRRFMSEDAFEQEHGSRVGDVETRRMGGSFGAQRNELASTERLRNIDAQSMAPPKIGAGSSQTSVLGQGVLTLPEPNEAMPGEKPGSMYSVKRKTELLPAAQRGKAGAGDVLRDLGRPIIYVPRGTDYP